MTIDPIPSPKPRTVWAVATSRHVYGRIRAIAIARQTSNAGVVAMAIDALERQMLNAKVVAAAIDALEHTEPRKETRNECS